MGFWWKWGSLLGFELFCWFSHLALLHCNAACRFLRFLNFHFDLATRIWIWCILTICGQKNWKQRLSKLPKLPILRSGPDRMMGGADLCNLKGLGCQAKRPVGDLIFIYVFDLQGLFYCSSQFSEPKWKTSCSPAVEHFQELFNVKKAPCWLSKFFFNLVLKTGGNNKNTIL